MQGYAKKGRTKAAPTSIVGRARQSVRLTKARAGREATEQSQSEFALQSLSWCPLNPKMRS